MSQSSATRNDRTSQTSGKPALDIHALIREKYPQLPVNQQKIADYILRERRDAPFLSITELGQKTRASKATIVRLAQRLGFKGFLEMRATMLRNVQHAYRIPDLFAVPAGLDNEEALLAVARQDVRNINQTIAHLDRAAFRDVARMIANAHHVYTVGLGISSLMSQVLAYSLSQVGVRSSALVHGYETFVEQLPFITSSDLVVAFSFPPYSRETVDFVNAAAARKIKIIAFTDKETSPVSRQSIRVLSIRSQNKLFTNSISAISVVINALATEVALHTHDRAVKIMKNTERLLQEGGHYISP